MTLAVFYIMLKNEENIKKEKEEGLIPEQLS